jgi:ribonuclease HI
MALPQLSTQPLPAGRPGEPDFDIFKVSPISASFADRERRFHPPRDGAHPTELFSVRYNTCSVPGFRFIRTDDPKQMLMFIDGACANDGTSAARAGCGVVHTSTAWQSPITYPLEVDSVRHTSSRAKLRAAILALGMRTWKGEGFNSVVLACDSEYVVKGSCELRNKWIDNNWKNSRGAIVNNKDLWEMLLKNLRHQETMGVLVQFWQIPRGWNEAKAYAKQAALSIFLLVVLAALLIPLENEENGRHVGSILKFSLMERLPDGLPRPDVV